MFQKTITNLILITFLIFIGYALGAYFGFPGYSPTLDNIKVENDSLIIKSERTTIDSLTFLVGEYEKINNLLRDSMQVIVATRIVEVDAVRKLPLDSGVIFLKQKLGEYENRENL